MAEYSHRVRMAELACASQAGFEVSRIEEGFDRSYSILTIEKVLQQEKGPLGFLIGADAFAEIRTWHRWVDVIRLVDFIVVTRPGAIYDVPEGARVQELAGLELPESSSDIRARIARGESNVPVPAAVLAYIREHGLYGSQKQ